MPVCHDVCEPAHSHGFLLEQQWTVLLEQKRNVLSLPQQEKKVVDGAGGRAGISASPVSDKACVCCDQLSL